MKKAIAAIFSLILIFGFLGCHSVQEDWGSFTADRTESYDHKYYAVQNNVDSQIVVTVYNTVTDTEVFSFSPARAMDFHGICWESDSYNIWVQSGDIGVICYRFDSEEWIADEQAQRPADIISKYDK